MRGSKVTASGMSWIGEALRVTGEKATLFLPGATNKVDVLLGMGDVKKEGSDMRSIPPGGDGESILGIASVAFGVVGGVWSMRIPPRKEKEGHNLLVVLLEG